MKRLITVLAVFLLGGCSVNEIVTADETQLVVAATPKEESQLLDIGIIEFDAGIPEDNDAQDTGIYEPIRNAESRYLAYHLKNTMQGTGHWGAVRVIPSANAFTDVIVNARIRESNGEFVKLDVSVSDTSGQRWYERKYEAQTGISSYSENRDRRQDPYQKVFNDIANDLQAFVETLPPDYVQSLQQISELRFFADMAPLAYGEHLLVDEDGLVTINRLPAENDPAVQRLRQIRERDRLVVDMLNEHYANFYYGIAIPYSAFRKSAREEAVNYRQVKRSAALKTLMGVVVLAGSLQMDTNDSSYSKRQMKRTLQTIGISEGINTIVAGFTRNSEASIHVEAIEELAESFSSEAAPMVVNVQGESRRLTGTATAQYESWRKLLREIYEAETGFTGEADVGTPTRASDAAE
jgi:tRNA threonylcarbamoyladenosine modification (KEOPS) complex Cgi121 subunit